MPIPAQDRERIIDSFLELLLQDVLWKDVDVEQRASTEEAHCFSRRGHKRSKGVILILTRKMK